MLKLIMATHTGLEKFAVDNEDVMIFKKGLNFDQQP